MGCMLFKKTVTYNAHPGIYNSKCQKKEVTPSDSMVMVGGGIGELEERETYVIK